MLARVKSNLLPTDVCSGVGTLNSSRKRFQSTFYPQILPTDEVTYIYYLLDPCFTDMEIPSIAKQNHDLFLKKPCQVCVQCRPILNRKHSLLIAQVTVK